MDTEVTTNFEGTVNELRSRIKTNAVWVKDIKAKKQEEEVIKTEDRGEVMANLTLAYRHLEDAAMRMGKVLQAHDGGVSVYDK